MKWPFTSARKIRLHRLATEAAQSRNILYSKLFEIDELDHALDDMVRKSLQLMHPGLKKDDPRSD